MCVKETHKNKSGIKIYIYVYGGSVDCGSAAGGRVEQCVWGVVLREADSQAWSPASDHVSSFKYVDQRSAGPSMSLYVWGRERTPGPSWTSFRPWQRRAVGLRRRRGHCSRCCQVKPSRWLSACPQQRAAALKMSTSSSGPPGPHGDLHNYPVILGTDWPGFNNILGHCVGMRPWPCSIWTCTYTTYTIVSALHSAVMQGFSTLTLERRRWQGLQWFTPWVISHLSSLLMKLYAQSLTKSWKFMVRPDTALNDQLFV